MVFHTARVITICQGGEGGEPRRYLLTVTDDERHLQVVASDVEGSPQSAPPPLYIASSVHELDQKIRRDGHWWQDYAGAENPEKLDVRA